MPSRDLVFRFLGIDGGAGREFDKMAGKSAALEHAVGKVALGFAAAGVAIGVESVRAAAKFQTAMELIHTQAGRSQKTVDQMSKAVLAMSAGVATGPDELAKGLYHLASTGMSTAKSLQALKIAAEGAKLGGADLESVTNALNATLASGIKGAHNMSQAMGALNAVVGAGDMRMQDLAEALGTGVLAAVKGFGLSLNDVGAALATFGDNNIRGADAATQLRMAVLFMAKPAAGAKDALKSLGMNAHTLANDMGKGGLGLALTDLHTRLLKAGDTGSKMGQILLDMFGHKAGTGLAILEQQFGRFQQKQEEVQKGSKNFASSWTGYTQTFGYSWDRARTAFQTMTIEIGQKLLPTATKAMNWLGTTGVKDLEKFSGWVSRNKTPIEDIAKILAGIAAFRFASSKLNDVSRLLGIGSKGLGGAGGSILGSAKPIPVYVTNAGFGGGGGVGVPGGGRGVPGEPMPIPGGGSGIPGIGTGVKSFVKSLPLYAVGAQHDQGAATVSTPGAKVSGNAPQNIKDLMAQVGKLTQHNKAAADSFHALGRSLDVKTVQAWIGDWKQGNPVLSRAADMIGREKHELADFRSLSPKTRAAVADTIAQLQRIPGAMRVIAADARAAGNSIGDALDAGITVGIQQGSGKVRLVTKTMVDGVIHTAAATASIASPSKKMAYLGEMLAAGLSLGMRAGKKGVGQAASELMDTVRGTVIGAGSLGNVGSGATADTLGAMGGGGTSIQDILAFTHGQVVKDKAFARNLAIARKHGLKKSVAQQIAQLGPEQGGAIAASIAGASKAQINQLNHDEAKIGKLGTQISGVVSLSDTTIAKIGRAVGHHAKPHVTSPAQLDHHNGKKIVAHG